MLESAPTITKSASCAAWKVVPPVPVPDPTGSIALFIRSTGPD
jgi:hypothetical protein